MRDAANVRYNHRLLRKGIARSITYDTMTRNKLLKLRREHDGYWHSQPRPGQLESLAKRLGRKKVNRGKEPTYRNETFPDLRPLSIPMHKGQGMAPGTKNSILIQLEDDLIAWENWLLEQERKK